MRAPAVAAMFIAALITMPILPTAANAQAPGRGMERKDDPKVNPLRKEAEEKAYKDSLSKIPAKEQNDPWGGIREQTPTAKPSPPKKKPNP